MHSTNFNDSSRHHGTQFILQDYTRRMFQPPYNGATPRKRFPNNINHFNNNVLNLTSLRAVSPNGKSIMYAYEPSPSKPKLNV